MEPDRRLPARSRRWRPRNAVTKEGKSPEKRLAPRSRTWRRSQVVLGPAGAGMAPASAFPWRRSSATRSQRFHTEVGSAPERAFPARSSAESAGALPSSRGTGPERELAAR
uniref:Uncharacterized protein n=1 Tax=Arundo donax TaxID=35708 RepID=A0A0A9GI26_ARUDO